MTWKTGYRTHRGIKYRVWTSAGGCYRIQRRAGVDADLYHYEVYSTKSRPDGELLDYCLSFLGAQGICDQHASH